VHVDIRSPNNHQAGSRQIRTDEHLRSFYLPADRNVAVDGGTGARRHRGVSPAAVAPLPQVDFPTINVTATLTAQARRYASTVATPLEFQFGQIASVSQMSSVSSLGSTVVTLQFDLNRNIDGAAQDVQRRSRRPVQPAKTSPRRRPTRKSIRRTRPS